MMYPRLRDLREDADLSQEELGQVLNCHQAAISQYERGVRSIPLEHLVRLALLYNTSVDYILGLTNEPGVPWNDWPPNK